MSIPIIAYLKYSYHLGVHLFGFPVDTAVYMAETLQQRSVMPQGKPLVKKHRKQKFGEGLLALFIIGAKER